MPHSRFRGWPGRALPLALSALLSLLACSSAAAAQGAPDRLPPAAAAGDARGDSPPVPTYRTRIPASASVTYRLSRSGIVGRGLLDWQADGAGYRLRLEGSVPLIGTLIVQTSHGGFDAAGLAPARYTDKRLRRTERAATFDRQAGRVNFTGDKPAVPLAPGMQDRLSVMVQLAAIANAWAAPPAAGTVVTLPVVGARGDARLWALRYEGPQTLQTAGGAVRAYRFLREPQGEGDTRAEFWLDPAASCLPVRARLTDDDGDVLELLRTGPTP